MGGQYITGYSWGIRGVHVGYTYVSVMYRLCIGYVSVMCRLCVGGNEERGGSYSNFVQCFSVKYILISSSLMLALPYIVRFNALSLLTYPSTIPLEKSYFNALFTATTSRAKPLASVLNSLKEDFTCCSIHSFSAERLRSLINKKNPFTALYNSLNHWH